MTIGNYDPITIVLLLDLLDRAKNMKGFKGKILGPLIEKSVQLKLEEMGSWSSEKTGGIRSTVNDLVLVAIVLAMETSDELKQNFSKEGEKKE